jgi:hypothetical protein
LPEGGIEGRVEYVFGRRGLKHVANDVKFLQTTDGVGSAECRSVQGKTFLSAIGSEPCDSMVGRDIL